jgi:hypothetical protein
LLLAVLLRAGVLWKYRAELDEDRDNYYRIAEQIAGGHGYADPQTGRPTAYRPPLYPLLLAAIIRTGGGRIAIGAFQLLLGVATGWLTFECGRRLNLGRGSLIAGALVAIDPILLYQTSQVMTETLAAFLATMCLSLSLRPSKRRWALLVGISFGAACLCRPTFWTFGILAGSLWLAGRIRVFVRQGWNHGVERRCALAVLLGVLTVVSPWVIRNQLVFGRPIMTTTHGGYTLLLPHNPEYTRAVVEQPWGTVWHAASFDDWSASVEAELAAQQPPLDHTHLKPHVELARDKYLNAKARAYIQQDPVTAIKAGLTLLGRMWSVMPAAVDGTERASALRLAIAAFYIPLLIAFCIGLYRALRSGVPAWRLPIVLIFSYSAVHFLYWADMRMRAPLVPAIALLAVAGWVVRNRVPARDEP